VVRPAAYDAPRSVTANFTPRNVSVTVRATPDGRTFRVDSNPYTSEQTFSWQEGSSHTLAIDTEDQIVAAGERYHFTSWSDGGSAVHAYVTPSLGETVTAGFVQQYELSTSVTPPGSGSVLPSDASWHNSGSVIPVSATRNTGYDFVDWSGDLSGAANPSSLTMSAPRTVTADFAVRVVDVTVDTNPTGLAFFVDTSPYAAAQVFSWQEGTSHVVEIVETTQPGIDGERFVFSGWSDAGAASHTYVAPSADESLTANFTQQFRWTTAVSPGGAGSVTPASDSWYDAGTVIAPEAIPSAGYEFREWTGNLTGTSNPASVTMAGPKDATAEFSIYVDVDTSPTGLTTWIDGMEYTAPQTFLWIPGDTHGLSVNSPQPGGSGERFVWQDWSDAGAQTHDVSPTTPSSFSASFDRQYELVAVVDPLGSGATTPLGSTWHDESTVVQVSAAGAGYEFAEWHIDASGTASPTNVTMDAAKSVTARFNAVPIADAGTDHSAKAAQTVTLDATGSSDPDAWPSVLTFQWTQLSGPEIVTLTGADTATAEFSTLTVGTYIFEVTVFDGLSSDADSVQVDVIANIPPVADAGMDVVIDPGTTVVLDAGGSDDPDGYPKSLAYAWSQLSGPEAVGVSEIVVAEDFEDGSVDGLSPIWGGVWVIGSPGAEGSPSAWYADAVGSTAMPSAALECGLLEFQFCMTASASYLVVGLDDPDNLYLTVEQGSTNNVRLLGSAFAVGSHTVTLGTYHLLQIRHSTDEGIRVFMDGDLVLKTPGGHIPEGGPTYFGFGDGLGAVDNILLNTGKVDGAQQALRLSLAASGVYEFEVSVSDGANSDSDIVSVTVNAPPHIGCWRRSGSHRLRERRP